MFFSVSSILQIFHIHCLTDSRVTPFSVHISRYVGWAHSIIGRQTFLLKIIWTILFVCVWKFTIPKCRSRYCSLFQYDTQQCFVTSASQTFTIQIRVIGTQHSVMCPITLLSAHMFANHFINNDYIILVPSLLLNSLNTFFSRWLALGSNVKTCNTCVHVESRKTKKYRQHLI